MANPIVGKVEFQISQANPTTVMTFDPVYRRLNLLEEGEVIAYFDAKEGGLPNFYVSKGAGSAFKTIHFLKNSGEVSFGAKDANGRLIMLGTDGKQKIRLNADEGICVLGGNGSDGDLTLNNSNSKQRFTVFSKIAECR